MASEGEISGSYVQVDGGGLPAGTPVLDGLQALHRRALVAHQLGIPPQCLGGYLYQTYKHRADQLAQRAHRARLYRQGQPNKEHNRSPPVATQPRAKVIFLSLQSHQEDTTNPLDCSSPSPELCNSSSSTPSALPATNSDDDQRDRNASTLPRPPPPPPPSQPTRTHINGNLSGDSPPNAAAARSPVTLAQAWGAAGPGPGAPSPAGDNIDLWDVFCPLEFIPTDQIEVDMRPLREAFATFALLEHEVDKLQRQGADVPPTVRSCLGNAAIRLLALLREEAPDVVASLLLELPPDATERVRRSVEHRVMVLGGVCQSLSRYRHLFDEAAAVEPLRRDALMLGDAVLSARRLPPPSSMWELMVWSCALMQVAVIQHRVSKITSGGGGRGGRGGGRTPAAAEADRALRALTGVDHLYDIVRHIASVREVRRTKPGLLSGVVRGVLEIHAIAATEAVVAAMAAATATATAAAAAAAAGSNKPPPPGPDFRDRVLLAYTAAVAQLQGGADRYQSAAVGLVASVLRRVTAARQAGGAEGDVNWMLDQAARAKETNTAVQAHGAALRGLPDLARGALMRGSGDGGGGGGVRSGPAASAASASASAAASSAVVVLGAGPLARGERSALAGALLGLELEGRGPRLSCAGGPGLHSALAATAALNHLRQHVALPGPISPRTHPPARASAAGGAALGTASEGTRGVVAFRLVQQAQQHSQAKEDGAQEEEGTQPHSQRPLQKQTQKQRRQQQQQRNQGPKGTKGVRAGSDAAPNPATSASSAASASSSPYPRVTLATVEAGEALSDCVRDVVAEMAAAGVEEAAGAQQRVLRRGAGAALRLRWPRSGGGDGSDGGCSPGPGPGPEERVAWCGELLRRLAERHCAAAECAGWREVELATELLAEVSSCLARSGRDLVVVPLLVRMRLPNTTSAPRVEATIPSPPEAREMLLRCGPSRDPRVVDQVLSCLTAEGPREQQGQGQGQGQWEGVERLGGHRQCARAGPAPGPEMQAHKEGEEADALLWRRCMELEGFVWRAQTGQRPPAQAQAPTQEQEQAAASWGLPTDWADWPSGSPSLLAPGGLGPDVWGPQPTCPPHPPALPGWRSRARLALRELMDEMMDLSPESGKEGGGGGGGGWRARDEAPGAAFMAATDEPSGRGPRWVGGPTLADAAPSAAATSGLDSCGDSAAGSRRSSSCGSGSSGSSSSSNASGSGEGPGAEAAGPDAAPRVLSTSLSSYLSCPLLLVAVECERGAPDRAEPVEALRGGSRGAGKRPGAGPGV